VEAQADRAEAADPEAAVVLEAGSAAAAMAVAADADAVAEVATDRVERNDAASFPAASFFIAPWDFQFSRPSWRPMKPAWLQAAHAL
jgi:hypothetical protein